MLGTEYNWLVESTNSAPGAPKIRLAGGGMITLAIGVFCLVCVAARAEPAHLTLLREAAAASKAGDNPLFLAKAEAAHNLRPDYPRVIFNLARAYAASARPEDAVAELRELVAMGLVFDFTHDERLASLRARPDFIAVTQASLANNAPAGQDEAAFAITGLDGIIEGAACHPQTLAWYFSDVHHRCIWVRDTSGAAAVMKKFTSDADHLLGVFGLRIDVAHNSLWAGTAALPEVKDYTAAEKGRAALVEFDLATGRVKRSFAVPADGRDHVLGDPFLAADGTVFAADSTAPVIWRLAPGATQLENWVESADFVSLQSIAPSADGKSLVVSDYANGLWRVDLASRALKLLAPPAHTTLFGIDGLYAAPGGLIAVQNGVEPQRILRITLGVDGQPTGAKVLLAGHEAMPDLSLGQVIGNRFHFIGNSGWALYGNPQATPAPRNVTILSTVLD